MTADLAWMQVLPAKCYLGFTSSVNKAAAANTEVLFLVTDGLEMGLLLVVFNLWPAAPVYP
jgi:hypothetical protein